MNLIKRLLTTILFILLMSGCQSEPNLKETKKMSAHDLEAVIEDKIDSFYIAYKRYNGDWIDYFEDEFTNVFPDTPIRKTSRDSTKALWNSIYSRYDVQLLDRGKPSFITSESMVISHNSFHEILIHKQTRDTTNIIGTYIVAWKRQTDNSWKIAFESVQNN